jgi:hypothetical protein
MLDEAKKEDIWYIDHSREGTTFRDVIGTIRVKYRVIGEPDQFTRYDGQKSTYHSGPAYVTLVGGSTVIPVVAAVCRIVNVPT